MMCGKHLKDAGREMDFTVWKDFCIGSLYALSILIYLCFGGVEVLGPSRWKEMLSLQMVAIQQGWWL
jgi:hypothetical protein